MEAFLTPFKVGLLVIAGLFATLILITRLTGDGLGTGSGDHVTVYAVFDDVTGLAERSRISLAGIPVGEIASIKREGSRARVTLRVEKSLELYQGTPEKVDLKVRGADGKSKSIGSRTVYKNGATVAKKQASLIGDYYLEITPGLEGERLTENGQIMNINEGVNVEEIFENLKNITDDIEQVTGSLAAVFGGEDGQKSLEQILRDLQTILRITSDFVTDARPKIDQIVGNVRTASSELSDLSVKGSDSIETILADAEDVVKDTKTIMREVKYVVGQSSGDVQAGLGTISGTLLRLQSTLDSLNYSLQNVQDITDKVNEGEGTLGALVNDPGIAEKTDGILEDVGSVTDTIGRLRTSVSLRSERHFLANQWKNVVGLKLQTGINKYFLIEIIDAYRQLRRTDTEYVTDPITGMQEAEITTKFTDDYKITAQYGIGTNITDWLAFVGRFGLMESSGGLGADLYFFEDRWLEVRMDAFDFSYGSDWFRLRLTAEAQLGFVAPWLWVNAGLDDMLNGPNPDVPDPKLSGFQFFGGIGVRFNDEDLKGLLGVIGIPRTN